MTLARYWLPGDRAIGGSTRDAQRLYQHALLSGLLYSCSRRRPRLQRSQLRSSKLLNRSRRPAQPKQEQQQAPRGSIGLDRSMSLRKIDPLQFVKSPMPLLSADTKRAPERALGRLEDAAARDEACVWQRVSEHEELAL